MRTDKHKRWQTAWQAIEQAAIERALASDKEENDEEDDLPFWKAWRDEDEDDDGLNYSDFPFLEEFFDF